MSYRALLVCCEILAVSIVWASDAFAGQAVPIGSASVAPVNPLLAPSRLPFQAPPFDEIKDSDFAPAFAEGMKQQIVEVVSIANNTAPPTFDNTLVALERSGQTLSRVSMVFNALTSANTNDALQKLLEEIAPKLSAHQDAISLNRKLFDRIKTLYNARGQLHLAPEAERLLEYQYQQFVMAGALLSESDKARVKKLNEDDASLSAKFTNQLLAAAKNAALVVGNQDDLAGLSRAELDAAADAARKRQTRRQVADPAEQHDAATGSRVAGQPRDARAAVSRVVDSCRARRRERHSSHDRPSQRDPRREGEAARIPEFRRMATAGSDGQDARSGAAISRRPRARGDREGSDGSR